MGVRLGDTDIYVSEVGVGTIAWGDSGRGYGSSFDKRDVNAAVQYLVENGVNLFDCAEVYGYKSMRAGECAEQLLGDAVARLGKGGMDLVLSSKFFPVPWTNALIGGGEFWARV